MQPGLQGATQNFGGTGCGGLAQGRMEEAVVHVRDLPRAQALVFVNSLRGWVKAHMA